MRPPSRPYTPVWHAHPHVTPQVNALQLAASQGAHAATADASRLLALYRTLTSMDVGVVTPGGSGSATGVYAFRTTEPGTGETVSFTLDVYEEGGGAGCMAVEYTPGGGCAAHLPPFLRAPILFGTDQLPMFLAKVTEALRHMRHDGSAVENGVEAAGGVGGGGGGAEVPTAGEGFGERESHSADAMEEDAAAAPPGDLPLPSSIKPAAGEEVVAGAASATPSARSGRRASMARKGGRTPAHEVAALALASPPAGGALGLPLPPVLAITATPAAASGSGMDVEGEGEAPPSSALPRPSTSGMAEGTAAAAEAEAAVERVRTRRTARAKAGKGSALAPPPTSASKPGRRSVGHVVPPEGFLFTASPGPQ